MMSIAETVSIHRGPLEAALAEYEMALEQGLPVDRQEFLARHADEAVELGPLLEAGERARALTRPLREALEGRPPLPLPALPGYEILEILGIGGMGVVYRARQQGTEQEVALKMMRADWVSRLSEEARREAVEQVRVEVKAAARLRHPNRVRVLLLGEHEGLPYYVMELVQGRSLAELAKRSGGVSQAATAKYLAGVAEAVHEAHGRGILHRDLKPHNILIEEHSDEALLTDFGLAKMSVPTADQAAGDAQSVRSQARLAGTIPYMSPEHTRDADAVTEASDVYSLGATFYDLLTGRPPFQGEPGELLERIRYQRPAPPRTRRADVNPRLERICLKCLEKDPGRRYTTALEFAGALRFYLEEIRYARTFTTMGTMVIGLGPVFLLLNLTVYLLQQIHFYEPVVWLAVFAGYPALFGVFLMAPPKEGGQESRLSREEMWSVWGGHFFAAVTIAVVLRTVFWQEPDRAILLFYPVFAVLTAMANCTRVANMTRRLYLQSAAGFLAAVLMTIRLEWSPILYGLVAMVDAMIHGLYLRQLGRELR
jgi:hypothetical protein